MCAVCREPAGEAATRGVVLDGAVPVTITECVTGGRAMPSTSCSPRTATDTGIYPFAALRGQWVRRRLTRRAPVRDPIERAVGGGPDGRSRSAGTAGRHGRRPRCRCRGDPSWCGRLPDVGPQQSVALRVGVAEPSVGKRRRRRSSDGCVRGTAPRSCRRCRCPMRGLWSRRRSAMVGASGCTGTAHDLVDVHVLVDEVGADARRARRALGRWARSRRWGRRSTRRPHSRCAARLGPCRRCRRHGSSRA